MPKRIATGVLRSLQQTAITLVQLSGVGSQLLLSSLQTRRDHRTDWSDRLPRIIPTTIARPEEIRVFRLTPKVISFLIARTGFGHMDLVML